MKAKKIIYLFLALIAAGVAAGATYMYLLDLEEKTRLNTEYTEVTVAARDIAVNETITAEMLKQQDIPRAYLHDEAVQDPGSLIGSISKTIIYEGEQMLKGKLAKQGESGDEFVYLISPGKRALALPLNEVVGVGGLLVPGDHVDVIATLDSREEEETVEYSKIIIQNVRVLAIGKRYDPLKFKEITEQAGTITLEVTPEEAPSLVLASEKGSIRLMLRSSVDEERVTTPTWKMRDYLR